ncbi:MAG: hypothetical protein V7L31_10250 [Nostoc sp.]|uniref:hypothetical protein n=1 Tax=Nostoc sp. TaxID=1180 RepID=UPI002FEEDBA5
MSNTEFRPCPICSTPTRYFSRYPRAVCDDCYSKASDDQGRKLSFFNTSMSGGFEGIITETKEKYESHICYIDGVKCCADEARFGGIVIEMMKNDNFSNH